MVNAMKLNKQVQELAGDSRSTVRTTTKPTMGGLAQGQCGKEACVTVYTDILVIKNPVQSGTELRYEDRNFK